MRRFTEPENHKFTYQYAQPAEYRYCQDSIIAPMVVAELLGSSIDPAIGPDFRVLDLCAGCGVFGFELAHYQPGIEQIDFVEIQGSVFREPFERNLEITARGPGFRFIETNYANFDGQASYDVIVANPPYFFEGDGLLSPYEIKNRCRFFLDASFNALLECILRSLKPSGRAFVLIKSGVRHGRDLHKQARELLGDRATLEAVADIRGTDLVQITKQ